VEMAIYFPTSGAVLIVVPPGSNIGGTLVKAPGNLHAFLVCYAQAIFEWLTQTSSGITTERRKPKTPRGSRKAIAVSARHPWSKYRIGNIGFVGMKM
jgi:hypothetical protein